MRYSLNRFTTEYVFQEDRLRLSGQCADQICVIWLSHRLLRLVLPSLWKWLERSRGASHHVLHAWEQQAARASLKESEPVTPHGEWVEWLATTVNIKSDLQHVSLELIGAAGKDGDDSVAILPFNEQSLRQWLGIVRNAFIKGDWPLENWPVWMDEKNAIKPPAPLMFH